MQYACAIECNGWEGSTPASCHEVPSSILGSETSYPDCFFMVFFNPSNKIQGYLKLHYSADTPTHYHNPRLVTLIVH
jgi:hypothetical protein